MSGRLVRILAGLSIAGAVHAAVNAALLRHPPPDPPPVRRPVIVVVPVRDEVDQVSDCLATLLDQRGIADLRVVVVDDGSTDGTADVVRAMTDPRLRLVDADPPPPGWLGKTHACAVGVAATDGSDGGVLAFVDADVRLFPDALAGAVAVLDRHRLDLVSPWPRQLAGSLAERLVQPLQQWLWATTLPLRVAESSPRPSLAAANGQFLVLNRRSYDRAGGHAAVRGEVLDDIALLRAVKRSGGRGGPMDGSRLAACRMYDGWPALRDGYAKSLWGAVGGSPAASAAAAAALTAVWVVPPLAALRGSRAGLVGYAAGVAGRVVTAAATGGRLWPDPLAHPASVLALDLLLARSVIGHRRGTLRWKGRDLPAPERTHPETMGR
jgi:Glycosyl transferase family 2